MAASMKRIPVPLTDAARNSLEKIAFAFARNIERATERGQYALTRPTSLTFKDRKGGYSKQGAIGSEKFSPHSAYVGKRGTLIIVFKPVDSYLAAKYAFMEMEAGDCRLLLDGFPAYMDSLMHASFDEQVDKFNLEAVRIEASQNADIFNRYSEYGTW